MIAARSGGIPRNINNLCFNALTLGCALGRKRVDDATVLEAAGDLDLEGLARGRNAPVEIPLPRPQDPGPAALTDEGKFVSRPFHAALIDEGNLASRPVRAAALAASVLLASLFLFPSVRGLAGAQLAKLFSGAHWAVAKSPSPNLPAPWPIVSVAAPTAKKVISEPADTRAASSANPDVVVEVMPGQTLWHITLDHFGRSDKNLVEEVRALNPRITDPNHIEPGQRIVLPGRTQTPGRTCSAGFADGEAMTSARD
jgi:hypothetical protein